jgi:hypothetical protein
MVLWGLKALAMVHGGMADSAIQQIASHSIGVAKNAATMANTPSIFCLRFLKKNTGKTKVVRYRIVREFSARGGGIPMTTLTTEQDARVFLQGRSRGKLTGQREKLILQAARERLEATRIYELSRLHCEVQDEVLVIMGTVSSFYFKQLAQEAVKAVPGIQQILNQTDVVYRVDKSEHDREIETATRSRDLMRSKKAK